LINSINDFVASFLLFGFRLRSFFDWSALRLYCHNDNLFLSASPSCFFHFRSGFGSLLQDPCPLFFPLLLLFPLLSVLLVISVFLGSMGSCVCLMSLMSCIDLQSYIHTISFYANNLHSIIYLRRTHMNPSLVSALLSTSHPVTNPYSLSSIPQTLTFL